MEESFRKDHNNPDDPGMDKWMDDFLSSKTINTSSHESFVCSYER
ncbi:hypothetical protein LINPERPRIM_LOCUS30183, partial [Linum perenne]